MEHLHTQVIHKVKLVCNVNTRQREIMQEKEIQFITIMTKISPKLMLDHKSQTPEAQRILCRIDAG